MKKFISLLLAVLITVGAMAMPGFAATTDFVDVDTDNEVLVEAVDLLDYMGVAKGVSDTEFGADELVTREQFALFVYRLMKGGKDAPANASNTTKFTDLENPTYFYAISWANAAGIVNGRTETTFCPKDPITLQEAYAMLTRALEWEDKDTVYPYGHIEIAEQKGVELDKGLDASIEYADKLTRGDMAILLNNAFFSEMGIEKSFWVKTELPNGMSYPVEKTIHPVLCTEKFGVEELELQAVATPHYALKDMEATYNLGYDAIYFKAVEDEGNFEAYISAEDLGLDNENLDDYFLGVFTIYAEVENNEIEKVLFADCNMVKTITNDITLGTVSSNKANSYFDGTNAKLLSGKITFDDTEAYFYDAPYSYAKGEYNTEDKYEVRNRENLEFISFERIPDGDDYYYEANIKPFEDNRDDLQVNSEALLDTFYNVYYGGLYEATFYDVNADGLYDYIDYVPYTLFQVDSDEEEYFDDSDFIAGELSSLDLPYIYTNEATVVGEDFADEDVVIGYYSETNKFVKIAAVIKPTITTIDSYSKKNGTLTLGNGEVIDAVGAWKLFRQEDVEIVFDFDAKKEELIEASPLFTMDVLDNDEEIEFYIYDGILLMNTEVDTVSKFSENLIIPTTLNNSKELKVGPFDPATGSQTYYVYAYVDGNIKYVAVAVDEDIDNPIVDEDGNYNDDYTDTFCTYTEKNDVYTIVPLEFDLLEDGEVEKKALSIEVELLDDNKKEEQIFVPELGSTITKIAGSRFDIGFEKDVDFKSYSKIVVRVYDADKDKYKYVEYDASSFKRSLDEETVLNNMKAIIANNPDSKVRENLVLLYAETDNIKFKGKTDRSGHRIIIDWNPAVIDGKHTYSYSVINPYTSEIEVINSVNAEEKAKNLPDPITVGTMVNLVDDAIDEDEDTITDIIDTLWYIGEVDTNEKYFSITTDREDVENTNIFVDYDSNTAVTVVSADTFERIWTHGEVTESNMSTIAKAGKNVTCYNTKDLNKNGYITTHDKYARAYVSYNNEDIEDDENPMADYIIVVVYEDSNITKE